MGFFVANTFYTSIIYILISSKNILCIIWDCFSLTLLQPDTVVFLW